MPAIHAAGYTIIARAMGRSLAIARMREGRDGAGTLTVLNAIEMLAEEFKIDNPQFDRASFWRAIEAAAEMTA